MGRKDIEGFAPRHGHRGSGRAHDSGAARFNYEKIVRAQNVRYGSD
jgi:hypothetical protein